ncbi:MAG: aromatic amino acid ammonia-lyase [Devosia sp.]
MSVTLDGNSLTLEAVGEVARGGATIDIAPGAAAAVEESWQFLRRLVAEGRPIYGLTTGFGALDGEAIPADLNRQQQRCLLKSHAASVGPPMAKDTVRAMMTVRANVLASGLTGVSPEALAALIAMLNHGVTPTVPSYGSVGACGDLAPLAHMALPLIGLGEAAIGGTIMNGAAALEAAGIPLPAMEGRDGIALINGTEQTTGIGVLATLDAHALIVAAEEASALTMEAVGAVNDAFDERTALAKPHPGQIATSARLRALTEDSQSVLPPRPSRLRDALSLRCIPQVLGAARDAAARAEAVLTAEINAVNDNPLFGAADGFVTSNSGNFHGQHAAEALDQLATAMISVAVMSERRSARLVDRHHNGGLPAFLIHPDAVAGRDHGFMIAQYTAASLVAQMRMMAVPASIQSIPTCANTEDHVPMAPLAAQRAARLVEDAMTVVAIEALLATQAVDLRGLPPAPALRPLYDAVREGVPMMVEDRVLGEDIATVRNAIAARTVA